MEAVIEIKARRWAPLIGVPFTLGLGYVFVYFILINPDTDNPPGFLIKSWAVLMAAACLGVTYLFVHMSATTRYLFRADEQGFSMHTNGVHIGPISWSEIAEVREKLIYTARPGYVQVLAIYVQDPKRLEKTYPALIRFMMSVSGHKPDTTVLVEPALLGERMPEFRRLLTEKTGREIVPLQDPQNEPASR